MPVLFGLLAAIVIVAPIGGTPAPTGPVESTAPDARSGELRPVPAPRSAPMLGDPSTDPQWLRSDRRLTVGVAVSAVGLGLTAVGMSAVAVVSQTGSRDPFAEESHGLNAGPIVLAVVVTVLAAVPVTVFAVMRHGHRRPLRAYEAGLAGAGLQLRF